MQTHGLRYEVTERPWDELLGEFHELAIKSPRFTPIAEILRSVISSGLASSLAASTSMHDLVVVTSPPPAVPFDAIRVSVNSDVTAGHGGDFVTIRHLSVTGLDDEVSRPATEAVALFWRFVIEKFGLDQHSAQSAGQKLNAGPLLIHDERSSRDSSRSTPVL
ncbi:hypothetical protein [Subtercola boreus]|uniref:hypothetical protein n=1 Tax=Subtercola boreus TaxID=120213 RepID=UPI0011C056B7|nr:hypothetical protein [Subtercola boreus]